MQEFIRYTVDSHCFDIPGLREKYQNIQIINITSTNCSQLLRAEILKMYDKNNAILVYQRVFSPIFHSFYVVWKEELGKLLTLTPQRDSNL